MHGFALCLALSAIEVFCLSAHSGDERLEGALARAGENRPALEDSLARVPAEQRASLAFLIAHMPERDLRSLSAERLLDEVAGAHAAWEAAPWRERLPAEIFREYVLPYANVSEARDPWRAELRAIALPLIEGATTPLAAARKLNEQLFAEVKVRYSTARKRADQSPKESMETGLASCTGLSILLVDACRSVGIPARIVGTANWVDKRGNHTWVEVWDGEWHFTGAAEQDPAGFDRGWFVGDAAKAQPGREHGIFAVRWERTGVTFPLAWARGADEVAAEEVTARYARVSEPKADAPAGLFVKVLDANGRRVKAAVELVPEAASGGTAQRGESRDESADTNDLLRFELALGARATLRARQGDASAAVAVAVEHGGVQHVTLQLAQEPAATPLAALEARMKAWFDAAPEARAQIAFAPEQEELLRKDPAQVREAAWRAYRSSSMHEAARADFAARKVRGLEQEAPFTLREVGTKPERGWPLVIAMHGGGGAPQRVNDQQWQVMQRYYADQPDLGYLYLALRAPNNEWNGFYDDKICVLIENLIRAAVLCADVDPDRVSLIGYSHGGYGAFVIGTKIPDRFASIHSSAAAPTDGETRGENLRHTVFSFMVGGKDTAYGRRERCEAFDRSIQALRGDRTDIYPVRFELIEENGHTGLPDRQKVKELLQARRSVRPPDLVWSPSDDVLTDFFWVRVPAPRDGQRIVARRDGARIELELQGVEELEVLLDASTLEGARTVEFLSGGERRALEARPALAALVESLARRGDPRLACDVVLRWSSAR
jgi:predicted esterase